ncbi:MAG: hypothetical protein ACP5J4_21200 [Anaerolineae bacterium]
MRKVKFPVISIVLYALAGLFALYTIWAAIYSVKYISEMIAANQLVIKGSEFEVTNFLMTNFAQYAFFAITLFALGRIVQVISSDVDDEEDEELSFEEIADEDVDETDFEELEQNEDE